MIQSLFDPHTKADESKVHLPGQYLQVLQAPSLGTGERSASRHCRFYDAQAQSSCLPTVPSAEERRIFSLLFLLLPLSIYVFRHTSAHLPYIQQDLCPALYIPFLHTLDPNPHLSLESGGLHVLPEAQTPVLFEVLRAQKAGIWNPLLPIHLLIPCLFSQSCADPAHIFSLFDPYISLKILHFCHARRKLPVKRFRASAFQRILI